MQIISYILYGSFIALLVIAFIEFLYSKAKKIYHKTLRYETSFSTAKVLNKKHEEEYDFYLQGTVHHDEEFNVYLMYEGKQYCFNSKKLYKSVHAGDMACILVHKGYNKKNKLKHTYITIDE